MNGRTVNVATILRNNAFVEGGRKKYFRISKDAENEIIHRIRDVLLPEVARIAAEKADRRGSKTVMLVDALDALSERRA